MLSEDELERERAFDRLKGQRDAQSLANAERLAFNEGWRQGYEEGLLLGRIQASQKSLGQPVTPNEELLRLPAEELARLADQLTDQVWSKPYGAKPLPGEEGSTRGP
jgi:flagellar biosynthesis/type III secretory pathway protein FliH